MHKIFRIRVTIALIEGRTAHFGLPRATGPHPPWAGLLAGKLLGTMTRDVVITREEIGGLMAGLLAVASAPTGHTHLIDWAMHNRDTLGRRYASELARRASF